MAAPLLPSRCGCIVMLWEDFFFGGEPFIFGEGTYLSQTLDRCGCASPEIAVRVDDPHAEGLDPGLLRSDTLVAAEHAQGELVDAGLQHGSQLLLEVCGLVELDFLVVVVFNPVEVQQPSGVGRVVVVVRLDQREERLAHVVALVRLGGGRPGAAGLLGGAAPSGEAKAAPAAVARRVGFVTGTLSEPFLVTQAPGRAAHL